MYGTAKDDNIIRRRRFARWIPKAKDTHSEYVLLIVFPRQQSLRERTSVCLAIAQMECVYCAIRN